MVDLRIVGVDAEGNERRLLLCDEAGAEYALPIDEALRSAVTRPASSPAPGSVEAAASLSPRAIQARLRSGATVDEVVEASGLSREHVMKYAGPVADERDFYATRARQSVVARASTAEHHRLAFGDAPATLEAMTAVRLRTMGVPLSSVTWDAWRREDGLWAVICSFDAETASAQASEIGRKPPAEWVFDPTARALSAVNEWAQSLMTLPAAPTPARHGRRRLAAVDEPFDVDDHPSTAVAGSGPPARGSDSHSSTTGHAASSGQDSPVHGSQSGTDQQDLLDILRARRGQRLGADENDDDKLATLLTREEPAHSERRTTLQPVDEARSEEEQDTARIPGLEEDPEPPAEEPTGGTDAWGFSYADSSDEEPAGDGESERETEAQAPKPKKRSGSRRPAMPRWDDILFGQRSE